MIDEAGQFAQPDLLDLLRSNLRGARNIPIRVAIAANPGGPGHHWIARRYVFKAQPWTMFYEEKSKQRWVSAPSTFVDNEFIDAAQYRDQLESACPSDPELLRAWLLGDWAVARGAYFASALEESRVAIGPFTTMPMHRYEGEHVQWDHWISHDYGSSAPSVTYLIAKSPGAEFEGKFYPRGSLLVIDELAAVRRNNLNLGLGWTAATTAEAIVEFCKRWEVRPQGVCDDACFAKTGHQGGSLADEFSRGGVSFQPALKADRISGWEKMKRMLSDAGKLDKPGLYVSRGAEYFWSTVPFLTRDTKRIEDMSSDGPDHGADSLRYGLLYSSPAVGVIAGIGFAS